VYHGLSGTKRESLISKGFLHFGMVPVRFNDAQSTAAMAIAVAWKVGVWHRIKLANVAIKAVESKAEQQDVWALP
jgi:hypothetical protein